MKKKIFLTMLIVVLVLITLLYLTACSRKTKNSETGSVQESPQAADQAAQAATTGPIDFIFGKLWPFPNGSAIRYSLSDDNRIMTIDGSYNDAFGLTWEREFNLNGNRTLEVEILETGSSMFYSDEINPGDGNGKMLKVIIYKEPGGSDITLLCKESMKRANDLEFVMKNIGTLKYSLEPLEGDAIYKLGFVFFNAKLDGFTLRARFTE